ncbi:MAG: reverse transcriptase [Tissierella sp.]|nr:reverse transcriptase [Tissierella sp.]
MDLNKFKIKHYTHFDKKIPVERVIDNIASPDWVTRHGFYPFIHFKLTFYKYNKIEREKKEKSRDLYYASHIDSYIFKYYGDMLNHRYNEVANKLEINEVATAYRNNHNGKCNIHFAKEVIDFIKEQKKAFIYVADFDSFFDNLDHRYLKEKLKYVLDEDKLPDDYYALFKNVTQFNWVDKEIIEEVLKKKYKSNEKIKERTKLRYFDEKEFRKFKKSNKKIVHTNKKGFGIPQGAGVSSVFSNIYLIDFDKQINEYVRLYNGIYRRYCDDLIIIIPFEDEVKEYHYNDHIKFIEKVYGGICRLKIQPEKTEKRIYDNNQIYDESLRPSKLDYLGFVFDGINVKIREKSLFKYYSRAYKNVRLSNWKSNEYGRIKYRKNLYKLYSHLGKNKNGYGNFLSYVTKSQEIFDTSGSTNNLMENQVKNHWKYINRKLDFPKK